MDSWVLLVVVVVVFVVVKRGSGPASGIGSTEAFLGCIWVVLCVFQQFWQYRVKKNIINVRAPNGR